jgi:hypothetical protein
LHCQAQVQVQVQVQAQAQAQAERRQPHVSRDRFEKWLKNASGGCDVCSVPST